MNISKCSIAIKCDVDGCHNKAEKGISFDGVTVQYYLCEDCLKTLYKTLQQENEKEKVDVKSKKR